MMVSAAGSTHVDGRAGAWETTLGSAGQDAWPLLGAMALRDPELAVHAVRGAAVAAALCEEAGTGLTPAQVWGALLRDVGTLDIPLELLTRPRPLEITERAVMETHVLNSVSVIEHLDGLDGALELVRHHHERWDGKGYPEGTSGLETPAAARALAVADAFCAITTRRPHRHARPPEVAVAVVREWAGTQFDPELAAALEPVVARLPSTLRLGPPGPPTMLQSRAERAADLGSAQLQALHAAALGLDTTETAARFGRGAGTQRTWSASLRRAIACPPRVTLPRFLGILGREISSAVIPRGWDPA